LHVECVVLMSRVKE